MAPHSKFMFATGIENSYPTIRLQDGSSFRVDELEKTRHYQYWDQDLDLVKESGISFLRYGTPYYRNHLGPGRYDWAFSDMVFGRMSELGITPIVDLCHFGLPDFIGNFQNPDFPEYFAQYAAAFARRFPDLRYYTPINEIFITAMFSAQYGWWNECKTDETSCVIALKHLAKANLMAMAEILKVQPKAVFIQCESCEYFHPQEAAARSQAEFLNEKRFLPLDLTLGQNLSASMQNYLFNHGMSKQEYQWLRNNACQGRFVIGTDYYMTNEHYVRADHSTCSSGDLLGYYALARQYYERYKLPLMHTETNMKGPGAVEWLHKQWACLMRLHQEGIPILGFTWYSLTDQVDWDSALRENNNNINDLGMYDLDRKIRPLGLAYQKLIKDWTPALEGQNKYKLTVPAPQPYEIEQKAVVVY